MSTTPTVIIRSRANTDLPATIPPLQGHRAVWELHECPSCDVAAGACGPHPEVLICVQCEDDWPCASYARAATGR